MNKTNKILANEIATEERTPVVAERLLDTIGRLVAAAAPGSKEQGLSFPELTAALELYKASRGQATCGKHHRQVCLGTRDCIRALQRVLGPATSLILPCTEQSLNAAIDLAIANGLWTMPTAATEQNKSTVPYTSIIERGGGIIALPQGLGVFVSAVTAIKHAPPGWLFVDIADLTNGRDLEQAAARLGELVNEVRDGRKGWPKKVALSKKGELEETQLT